MDFRERVPLGRTGMPVSRIGLASGYGVPTAAIEKAFHEYRINYFYVSLMRRGNMARALRNLVPEHRDALCIVLAKPIRGGFFLQSFVERWLRQLGIERLDGLLLQGQNGPLRPKLVDRMQRLEQSGKVRYFGLSSHDRSFLGRLARGEARAPVDFLQIRYNAAHPGAEQDVFPHLPATNRHGIVIFTATCWGELLKPRNMPPGEPPPAAADCYRFALSDPHVDVCITGPSTAAQLDDNLQALDAGPLDDEELARMRRIGRQIHG